MTPPLIIQIPTVEPQRCPTCGQVFPTKTNGSSATWLDLIGSALLICVVLGCAFFAVMFAMQVFDHWLGSSGTLIQSFLYELRMVGKLLRRVC